MISGALDVLARQKLQRMRATVENLTEIMVALLYLSREPLTSHQDDPLEVDRLLPALVKDHEHLLDGKPVQFSVQVHQTLTLYVPEAMLRIAVGNLLRNAAENTYDGTIAVRLKEGVLSVTDSGEGFDTEQAVAAAKPDQGRQRERPGAVSGATYLRTLSVDTDAEVDADTGHPGSTGLPVTALIGLGKNLNAAAAPLPLHCLHRARPTPIKNPCHCTGKGYFHNGARRLAAFHPVDDHRQQQNRAANHVLIKRIDVLQVHCVFDDCQNQYASNDVTNHADPATQRHPAQHTG